MAKQPEVLAPPMIRTAAPRARMTIYFALLIISLVALLIACLFMYLEVRRFGGFKVVPGKLSTLERPLATQIAGHHSAAGSVSA